MTTQLEQYQDFRDGLKPLLVLEERKDAKTFHRALFDIQAHKQPYHVHVWYSPEGIEVVLAHDYSTIHNYLVTLHDSQLWDQAPALARRRLGKLFGYSNEEIDDFLAEWTPEFCHCSKCIGVNQCKGMRPAHPLRDEGTVVIQTEEEAPEDFEEYQAARSGTTSRLERDAMLARTQPYGR